MLVETVFPFSPPLNVASQGPKTTFDSFTRCHASGKFPELEELCDQFATFNVDEATKNGVMEYDMVFASPWQAGQRCGME